MRKLSFFVIILSAILLTTSCIEKVGPMGPAGRDGRDGRDGYDGKDGLGVESVVYIPVEEKNWVYSGLTDNNYFQATVPVPELTEEIFDGGVVKMYRAFDYDTQYATQIEMPYVRLREEYPEGGGEPFRYTELLDYDFGIGTVNIYFTVSDFFYGIKPGAMLFRCVLLY